MSHFKVAIQRKDQALSREVNKDSFTVGRSIDCDIALNDNHVSRVHLVVSRRWNQIWVEDKNSSNGTFINGTRIVQGTPVNVVGTDKIQLGKSEYLLQIDIEQPLPEEEPEIQAEVPVAPDEEAEIAETVAMPPPQFAQSPFQAEKLIHDAKRRAAQIVLEGETQAEKRVQAIYQKARETQTQADLFYQTRLSEAHKEADAILADYQAQGRELLQSARNMAQELREEVDVYVQGLREKARQDAENLIAETTLEAEKMKSEAMRIARETAENEGRHLLESSREEVNRVLEFTRLQVQEVQGKLDAGQVNLERVQKALIDTENRLRHTNEELAKNTQANQDLQQEMVLLRQTEEEKIKKWIDSEEAKLKASLDAEEARVRAWVDEEETRIKNWTAEEETRVKTWIDEEETRVKSWAESEESRVKNLVESEESRLKTWAAEEESKIKAKVKAEETRLKALIQTEEEKLQKMQAIHKDLEDSKGVLDKTIKSLSQRQAELTMDINGMESRKDHLFKEFESQKTFLNEKLEKEKSQAAKTEERRLEEMRIETSKRLKKLEQDLIEDVIRRKESIVRELFTIVEKEVVRHMQAAQWRDVAKDLQLKMMDALEGKVANISQSSATMTQPQDVMKRRKKEKIKWALSGVAAGLALFFVGQITVQQVASDNTPMQTLVQREAKKRQEDLEKRKFNPPQTEELKETYTDAVIYTQSFPEIYADEEFQQKLYKSVSQYMYKTWRVEEEKSIQVLATSRALVKELQERRGQIHPDFVKEGIQKMRDLELEGLERMKTILGTEVRVDSYRRFERNFYKDEMQRRRMAATITE